MKSPRTSSTSTPPSATKPQTIADLLRLGAPYILEVDEDIDDDHFKLLPQESDDANWEPYIVTLEKSEESDEVPTYEERCRQLQKYVNLRGKGRLRVPQDVRPGFEWLVANHKKMMEPPWVRVMFPPCKTTDQFGRECFLVAQTHSNPDIADGGVILFLKPVYHTDTNFDGQPEDIHWIVLRRK